ncbi:hypothetical protein SFRURICE_015882 [Spodoptera frugiperda]|nr:hypothetical protein SFRURICE_015882 [Spodoptera frugiperda]
MPYCAPLPTPSGIKGVTICMYVISYISFQQDLPGRLSPKPVSRDRAASRARAYRRSTSPPPLPTRAAPAPPAPRKHALSPAQAECLRAVFAALLWHEGIVHDAIACAAFLKFHPQLPKQGARVVTRPAHDVTPARHQRHSVEVSNAGGFSLYLRIHPTTLETLTRSGIEASTSRMRNAVDTPIREEENLPGPSTDPAGSSRYVVNVLPPAMRALVALWDALYEADQLTSATDKMKKEEKNENGEVKPRSVIRKKKEWNTRAGRTPYSVQCDLCSGANVPPPLAAHMRTAHPGCKNPTTKGFDRTGTYQPTNPQPSQELQPTSYCGQMAQKPISMSAWADSSSRGPPTPPGSVWQPAPPFQCLPALGAAPKAFAASDAARYHSLGRPMPPAVAPLHWIELAPRSPLGAGSSLLAQPSAALRRLIGCGDWSAGASLSAFEAPRVDSDSLMNSPVMAFIVSKRDLHAHRQKMDAAAMNWLLRSATQPTCVHDVMWWFCNALDKFARINAVSESPRGVIPTASASAICPGARAARGARAAFHAFLGSVSALAPSLPPASAAGLQAVRCWALHYSPHDRTFLHR